MIIEAQLGEIFALISLVLNTGGRGNSKGNYLFFIVKFHSSLYTFISLPSQNKFSLIRQMTQF